MSACQHRGEKFVREPPGGRPTHERTGVRVLGRPGDTGERRKKLVGGSKKDQRHDMCAGGKGRKEKKTGREERVDGDRRESKKTNTDKDKDED